MEKQSNYEIMHLPHTIENIQMNQSVKVKNFCMHQ